MRRILVDYARSHRTGKRVGTWDNLAFDEALAPAAPRSINLIALDDSLKDLMKLDPQQSQIVELRFFSGLSQSEIAKEIGVSQMHVSRLLRQSLEQVRAEMNAPE